MASYRSVTVYCSSSNVIRPIFTDAAEQLGAEFARCHIQLVNGGGSVGLMGVMARAVHDKGGRVVGVIPKRLKSIEGRAYEASDELILTETMRERKRIMYERSDAYVALAGGYGTLEEFLEVLTLRKLGYHDKEIVLLNTDGFYDEMLAFFDKMTLEGFSNEPAEEFFKVVSQPDQVLPALGLGDWI
ncbi:MAG: TIGR00730 family Rossman fold protein [Bacteroidetes Order II. Incertae sedis bacterium]|jgi:cytokinin riboside 5'-monophosphate phosphoribohydrolase|nr:TIGR00730 family Rossman fold protein [Bacteroidetes Order II. bacterium]MBT4053104.1 TIGR00730 family Rossman fold protein [Bacteroidetes Order II. bacterium]MBT4601660.1 TIGR00730 family Rossman fold protein [Bacteroidetes Order II. bacterium]MBT5249099.1 TIGR00730 family Rossman fold protein [Bacteroidetes Order II. bacterium]MBT6200697.1 TIGR00730 family Rossman fold protein [Bacteroidetes Order II. bacterium]